VRPGEYDGKFLEQENASRRETIIETTDGETFRNDICWQPPALGLATGGGFNTGLISAGHPELTTRQLTVRYRLPSRVPVARSVHVLAIAVLADAVVHALAATPVWYVIAMSVHGVLICGSLGRLVGIVVHASAVQA
jgi:hypothetical protein